MKNNHEIKISALKNGTVIDHIDAKHTLNVVKILNLCDEQLMIGINFESKKHEKKGVIKVSDKVLSDEELNKVAYISPKASIVKIKDYNIQSKEKVSIPKEFISVAKCGNVNCITNHQKINTHFYVLNKNPIQVKCKYCEKLFDNDLELL